MYPLEIGGWWWIRTTADCSAKYESEICVLAGRYTSAIH